jgi:hypothetical protein
MASAARILALHAKGLSPVAIACRLMTGVAAVQRVLAQAEGITPEPLPAVALPPGPAPEEITPSRCPRPVGPRAAVLLAIIREVAEAGGETARNSVLAENGWRGGACTSMPTAVSSHLNVLADEGLITRGGTRSRRTYAIPGTGWATTPAPLANTMKYGPEREGPPRSPTLEERRAMFAGSALRGRPGEAGSAGAVAAQHGPGPWLGQPADGDLT